MYCKWNSSIVVINYFIEFKKTNTTRISRRKTLFSDGYFKYSAMHY